MYIKTLFIVIIGKLFVECICSQKCYLFEVGERRGLEGEREPISLGMFTLGGLVLV